MVVSINWGTPNHPSHYTSCIGYIQDQGPRYQVCTDNWDISTGVFQPRSTPDRSRPPGGALWKVNGLVLLGVSPQRKPLQGFPVKFPLYQSIDIQNLEKNKGSFLEWPSKKSGPCMFRPSFILLFTCQMNRKNSALCILKTKKTEKNFQWDVQLRCCWLVNSTTETGRSHSHLWAAQMDLKKLIWAENEKISLNWFLMWKKKLDHHGKSVKWFFVENHWSLWIGKPRMLSEIITTDRNLLHSPGQPLGLTTCQPLWAICAKGSS